MLPKSVSFLSSHVMVSIAEFLIGHGSHGTVLLRYLRDLTLSKNEFLRKHKVCLNHSLSRHSHWDHCNWFTAVVVSLPNLAFIMLIPLFFCIMYCNR